MLHIKKNYFCAQQIIETNKIKFNKCTFSKVRNFCWGAVTVTASPGRRKSSYAIAQRNNLE